VKIYWAPMNFRATLRKLPIKIFRTQFGKSTAYVLAGAVGFLLVFFLIHLPHGPEHWSADLRTALWSKRLDRQHDKIALVEVTNRTLEQYPYSSPIDRKFLADLIRTIDAAGPKAIGLDFIFDRATETSKDEDLLQAIRGARARIVVGALDDELLTKPEKNFQSDFLRCGQCLVGHIYLGEEHANPVVISEHVIRLIAEPSNTPQGKRQSFAEVLAGLDGAHRVDEGRQIAWLLPPKDQTETFLTLPAEQVLAHDRTGLPIETLLHNKFVLIGGNFPDRDQHLTPLSAWSEARFSGLFIHAQILAQLLADNRIYSLHEWYIYWPLLGVVATLGFWTGRLDRSGHHHLVIELVSVIAFILVSILAFRYGNFIFPFVGALLAWMAGVSGGHYSRLAH
jgi:CHASE2 domain-containing sensor protein